jgi:hypothetical protein
MKKKTTRDFMVFVFLTYQVSDKRLLPGCGINDDFLAEV